MALTSTSKQISSLKINKVPSEEVYNKMVEQNKINDNELYLVQDTETSTAVIGTTTAYSIYIGPTAPASGTTPLLWIDTSSTGVFKYRTSTTGTWTTVPVGYT